MFQEQVDLRRIPTGWNSVGYDDSEWDPASAVGGRGSNDAAVTMPWCRLIPRDIEFIEEAEVYPEKLEALKKAHAEWNDGMMTSL